MDNDYTIITINGINYYVETSRLSDLKYINNKLVNISNSSITLVSDFDYQYTVYPRITCSSMSQCVFRQSQQSTSVGVSSNYTTNDFKLNSLSTNNLLVLIFITLFIMLGVKLIWKK